MGCLNGASLRDDPKRSLFRTIDRSTGKLNPHDAAGERVCDDPPLRRPGIGTKLGKPKVGVKEVELVTQIGLTRSDAFV